MCLKISQNDSDIKSARIFSIISGIGLIQVGIMQDKPEIFFKFFYWLSIVIFFFFNIFFIALQVL